MKAGSSTIALVLLLVAGGAAVPLLARSDAEFADIQITPVVADGRVSASFDAPAAFTDDSRELVKSGVPLTFTYLLDLRRPSVLWLDHTLGSATVAASVKFDSLTSIYQVTKERDGHVTWSKSTSKEDDMRQWITVFDAIPIQATEALEPNADYYVRVRLDARPHVKFSPWPWGRNDGAGRVDFTFIR